MTTTAPTEIALVPHNLDAEKSVLGAILVNAEAFVSASAILNPSDFFRDAHRRIFNKMVHLSERNEAIDFVTLKEELARSGDLEEVGGPAYIASLADGMPRSANVEHYARIIRQHASARTMLAYARQAIDTFTEDPGALSNGAGLRFADAVRRVVDDAHIGPPDPGSAPLMDDAAVLQLPEPEYIAAGRFHARSVVALIGDSGIGKTFVGLDLGLSVAAGRGWLGATVTKPGPVVYVAAEGFLSPRIGAWKIAHGYDLHTPLGLHTWSGAVPLLEPRAVAAFIAAVKPLRPVLVILDTLARCLLGGEENSARDMGLAVASLDRIRTQLDATVLVLHHMNKGGTSERGSGALRGACDTLMYLQKADDLLQLVCDKQKDAEPFAPVNVKLTSAYPGASTCVVRLAADVADDDQLTDAQGKALHALMELFGDLGATSKEWEDALPAMSRASFYRARRVLIEDRQDVRQDPHTKRFYATDKASVSGCLTPVSRQFPAPVSRVSRVVA